MSHRVVIFLHLPKAAGSTLIRVLERQYPAGTIIKAGGMSPEAVRAALAASDGRGGTRAITGHVPFGVHRLLATDFTYVTVLRDPVERAISHYHYARKLPSHPLHAEIARGLTLAEASRQNANSQTRYLADESVRGTAGTVDREALESAKANLARHFSVVGLAERFDETLVLLRRRLGWKIRAVPNSNVTRNRPARSAHSDSELAAVRAANELDAELYAWVRERFDAEVAAAGPEFQSAVRVLRLRNRLLQFTSRLIPARLSR